MKKVTLPIILFAPAIVILLAVMPGCTAPVDGIVQYSTIDALLVGAYDGFVELEELDRVGNLGIGTFDRLDGEMIFLDNEFWQARADGKVVRMKATETTPFASVCEFRPDFTMDLQPADSLAALTGTLDGACKNTNGIYAVKITGNFPYLKTRSVPSQQKPYRPLTEVTKNQPEFEARNSSGTIVGFRLPAYVKSLNVPGWHLHFLSDDRSFGGHILQLELREGSCQVDSLNRLTVELEKTGQGMAGLDLTKDRSEDLRQVEGSE
jgi:acetolactate decarboxylase